MWDMQRSVRWACWLNAWLGGDAAGDTVQDAVLGEDAAHDVLGLSPERSQPLLFAWGELRRRGATGARLVLPEPGDLYGLGGPPAFNRAATEAGEGVVVLGADVGAVPQVVGGGVFWHTQPATPGSTVEQVPEAEQHLREELIRVSRELTDLDVARWQPEIRLALSEVREDVAPPLAPGYTPRADRLAALAHRCLAICTLGSDAETAAISAYEFQVLDQNLQDLARAARHGLVAACSNGRQR